MLVTGGVTLFSHCDFALVATGSPYTSYFKRGHAAYAAVGRLVATYANLMMPDAVVAAGCQPTADDGYYSVK